MSLQIHPKAAGGLVGGWVAVILLYMLSTYAHFNPPSDVAGAITGLIGFLVAYVVPADSAPGAPPVVAPPPVVVPPSPPPPAQP